MVALLSRVAAARRPPAAATCALAKTQSFRGAIAGTALARGARMQRLRIILGHLVRWVWMPVLAKMCLWIGAFVALAHVGTNAAVRVTSPAPLTADRAIGHTPSASVSASASARASPCASG